MKRAVGEALAYLERAACRARRGKGGVQRVRGRVAAAFRHRTSRAGDPQLHTHVVVGNLTEGPDGRWTALDGRLFYKHAKTAGYLYQAALRAQLTERPGVRWTDVDRGFADIVGIPRKGELGQEAVLLREVLVETPVLEEPPVDDLGLDL